MNDLDLEREGLNALDQSKPILEAVHLRKFFPLHSLNPLGQNQPSMPSKIPPSRFAPVAPRRWWEKAAAAKLPWRV